MKVHKGGKTIFKSNKHPKIIKVKNRIRRKGALSLEKNIVKVKLSII
jgi:predicted RNase H-related nuclease YkuK (DUF458 family)